MSDPKRRGSTPEGAWTASERMRMLRKHRGTVRTATSDSDDCNIGKGVWARTTASPEALQLCEMELRSSALG
eukprot:15442532-Alexandrium_andersonii.AAC.1